MKNHARPELRSMVEVLSVARVEYIIAGSVAVMLHGVQLEPGDLDIVPDLTEKNLSKLAGVISEIGGIPESLGTWLVGPDSELKWRIDSTDPEELARWKPDPADADSFDHRFLSRLGDFDVVPRLAGEYSVLCLSAKNVQLDGLDVRIASIEELLTKLTVPRRAKDVDRVRTLRELQRACRGLDCACCF